MIMFQSVRDFKNSPSNKIQVYNVDQNEIKFYLSTNKIWVWNLKEKMFLKFMMISAKPWFSSFHGKIFLDEELTISMSESNHNTKVKNGWGRN